MKILLVIKKNPNNQVVRYYVNIIFDQFYLCEKIKTYSLDDIWECIEFRKKLINEYAHDKIINKILLSLSLN